MRNTVQKELIRATMANMNNHPTADMVYIEATKLQPRISKATVYRILNQGANNGEYIRIHTADSGDRFDINIEPHAHFKCNECNCIIDMHIKDINKIIDIVDTQGCNISGAELSLAGLCNDCSNM